jgi:hypothetical protein
MTNWKKKGLVQAGDFRKTRRIISTSFAFRKDLLLYLFIGDYNKFPGLTV